MRGLKYVFATAAVAFLFLAVAPESQPANAQLSIGIGVGGPPECPYGYYGYGSYNCAPMATTARNGSMAACSLEPAAGTTADQAFMAM